MIMRNCLTCSSCGTAITTRFGVGHGTKQVHSFPCPTCGVVITCVMRLDQKKVDAHLEDPINAVWLPDLIETQHYAMFHAEVLGPRKDFSPGDGPSPFVTSVQFFEDFAEFQKHERLRAQIRKEYWEAVKRSAVHFERRQWDLFAKEIELILKEKLKLKPAWQGRVQQMSECFGYSVNWFVLDLFHLWRHQAVRFARAFVAHRAVLQAFAEDFRKSGRFIHLWRQIVPLYDAYVRSYPSWMPILQLRYWKKPHPPLDSLFVSDKRFEELRTIYLNAFELLGRISVIALAVEQIAATGATGYTTKKGEAKTIWDFEAMDSGQKHQQLSKHAGTKHLVPLLDTKLRNGIGHYAAHYDASTDEVVCIKADGATLNEWRISYAGFCYALLEMVSHVFFAQQYFFDLLGLSKDLFATRAKPKVKP